MTLIQRHMRSFNVKFSKILRVPLNTEQWPVQFTSRKEKWSTAGIFEKYVKGRASQEAKAGLHLSSYISMKEKTPVFSSLIERGILVNINRTKKINYNVLFRFNAASYRQQSAKNWFVTHSPIRLFTYSHLAGFFTRVIIRPVQCMPNCSSYWHEK